MGTKWLRGGWWRPALVVLALAPLAIACGGDDDATPLSVPHAATATPDPPTPTPVRRATDEEYARGLCQGMARFFREFDSATRAIAPDDPARIPAEFAKALGGPLHQFASQMDAMHPPSDFEQWHDESVGGLLRLAREIQAGKALHEIISLSDEPLPSPPRDLGERLTRAARGVPECAPYEGTFARG